MVHVPTLHCFTAEGKGSVASKQGVVESESAGGLLRLLHVYPVSILLYIYIASMCGVTWRRMNARTIYAFNTQYTQEVEEDEGGGITQPFVRSLFQKQVCNLSVLLLL